MDKRVINEEQFRKLIIKEANKIIFEDSEKASSEEKLTSESKRKITFDKVESLIKEMEQMPKSISSIGFEKISIESSDNSEDVSKKPNRDLDVNQHNKNKNILHVNEGEKDKWNRLLNYEIPSDDKR